MVAFGAIIDTWNFSVYTHIIIYILQKNAFEINHRKLGEGAAAYSLTTQFRIENVFGISTTQIKAQENLGHVNNIL